MNIRYRFKDRGVIREKIYSIEQIELGCMAKSYEILSRDLGTGLMDKNGKEIFERDVLKQDDPNWGYGGDYDKSHDGYIRFPCPDIKTLLNGDTTFDPWDLKHYEIIGRSD